MRPTFLNQDFSKIQILPLRASEWNRYRYLIEIKEKRKLKNEAIN